MHNHITATGFLPWLARDVVNIVAKAGGRSPADDLWALALEALDWLRRAPAAERNAAMAAVKQYLATGIADDVAIPSDPSTDACFTKLLQWMLHPPPVI
ncbi:MAG: hypothetical protein IPO81_30705 [Kouleothrix sp.]|nr:hypothetical protein [Kouleothrix sp.]